MRKASIILISIALCVSITLVSAEAKQFSFNLIGDSEDIKKSSAACAGSCPVSIYWDGPQWGYGENNVSYSSSYCYDSYSKLHCIVQQPMGVGIASPGPFGCPNYCSNHTQRGVCDENSWSCQCNAGYAGFDCSRVSCAGGNDCSGRGKCQNVSGIETCVCPPGYSLDDCAAKTGPLPPITMTVLPDTQYTSWDQYGNNHPVFNDSVIAQIHIAMDPKDLQFLLNPKNQNTDQYMKADMWFYNGVIQQSIPDIGFRLKGGVSRKYCKKTWKISFNEFSKGRTWYQLKKLELKNMAAEPTATREKIAESMLYSLNCPTQRSAYATVWINDQSFGIALMIEAIDSQFLMSRFGNSGGPLYQLQHANLSFVSYDPNAYGELPTKDSPDPTYGPQTDSADNFVLLSALINILNFAPNSSYSDALETIFDVDLFLRTLVFEVATGQWDGMFKGKYWLYYNPDLQVFQVFQHDLHNSFGTHNASFPMTDVNVYTWGTGNYAQNLVLRVLSVPQYRQSYTDYWWQFLNKYFLPYEPSSPPAFYQRTNAVANQIHPAVWRDEWRRLDRAWSFEESVSNFNQSVIHPLTSLGLDGPLFAELGIAEYLAARRSSAVAQLDPPSTS